MEINNGVAKKLKRDFPIFRNNPKLIYLDSAASSQKPKSVIDAISKFYSKDYANIHRGVYRLSEKATELYKRSKDIVAGFIDAKPEEIVYTRSTTESINALAYVISSVVPKGKNEIVLTEMEHHSNLIPWQQLSKRKKFKLHFIKVKNNSLDLEDAKKKINSRTAIVALIHVSNSLGSVNNIKEIIKIAKSKKALTVLDAAQSVPHMKVFVKEIGCDFMAFSGHKMFGPTGIGVLYGKKELLERMGPFYFGGEMIKKVTLKDATWAPIPEKFEAGTPNIAGAIGIATAIKYIEKIGIENINSWECKLTDYAIEKLKSVESVEVYTSKNQSGIVSFNVKGVHPHDVASMLDSYGIAIRAGHHCNMPLMFSLGIKKGGTCRISFSVYNTFEDIDKLTLVLLKINRRFNK